MLKLHKIGVLNYKIILKTKQNKMVKHGYIVTSRDELSIITLKVN